MPDSSTRHLSLIHSPEPSSSDQVTVGEYLEDWLWGKQSLRASTHRSYEIHIRNHLVPALGELGLTELRPVHVQRMYRVLREEGTRRSSPAVPGGWPAVSQNGPALSAASLHRLHATLMGALNTAVRRGLLERNPAATVELPRVPKTKAQAWSSEELARFLSLISGERLQPLFLLLGLLGLRRGEVVALRWSDLDLNVGTLQVEQTLVRVGDRTVVGPPKSRSGGRVVALDDETARRLHWHRCRQRLETLRASGQVSEAELVFATPEGGPLDPAYVTRLFSRLIRRHGLRPIRLHDLRHTSASIGLASGESLFEVSRRLGHSSITITADVYGHISPEVAKESVERLASAIYQPAVDAGRAGFNRSAAATGTARPTGPLGTPGARG